MSSGEILYKGQRISGRINRETDRMVVRNLQMIFQDPMASINDRAKVDYIVSEGLMNVKRVSLVMIMLRWLPRPCER